MWLVNNNPTPLRFLHKWLILKIVEDVCDTLLQVLILKVVKVAVSAELGGERREG
jgi:hypothetical protein